MLRAGQSGGDVDDAAPQRRSAGAGVLVGGEDPGGAQQAVGDRRAQDQAELAPKRPDGRWASGPSIRSANTVSMIACWRWVMSAASTGRSVLVKNG